MSYLRFKGRTLWRAGLSIPACAGAYRIARRANAPSLCIWTESLFATHFSSRTKRRFMPSWWIVRAKFCGGRKVYSTKPREQACEALSENIANESRPTTQRSLFCGDELFCDLHGAVLSGSSGRSRLRTPARERAVGSI